MNSNVVDIQKFRLNYEVSGIDFTDDLCKLIETNFQLGQKNIAVASTHYYSLQQKFIIASVHYLNSHHSHLKLAIVFIESERSLFQNFIEFGKPTDIKNIINFGGHFDLISWENVVAKNDENIITNNYDFIFWDMPELEQIAKDEEKFRSNFQSINSLYLISNKLGNATESEFAENISSYFLNHGVSITSILQRRAG